MTLLLDAPEALEVLHEAWIEYTTSRLAFERLCDRLNVLHNVAEEYFVDKYGEDVICGY
jgi:hypothetical protein